MRPRRCEATAVRFLDILTMATSLARSRAADEVTAAHLLDAIGVLAGEVAEEGAGGGVSPLARPRASLAVEAPARDLMQRWFVRLGGAPEAVVVGDDLAELRADLAALVRS